MDIFEVVHKLGILKQIINTCLYKALKIENDMIELKKKTNNDYILKLSYNHMSDLQIYNIIIFCDNEINRLIEERDFIDKLQDKSNIDEKIDIIISNLPKNDKDVNYIFFHNNLENLRSDLKYFFYVYNEYKEMNKLLEKYTKLKNNKDERYLFCSSKIYISYQEHSKKYKIHDRNYKFEEKYGENPDNFLYEDTHLTFGTLAKKKNHDLYYIYVVCNHEGDADPNYFERIKFEDCSPSLYDSDGILSCIINKNKENKKITITKEHYDLYIKPFLTSIK